MNGLDLYDIIIREPPYSFGKYYPSNPTIWRKTVAEFESSVRLLYAEAVRMPYSVEVVPPAPSLSF